MVKKFNTKCNFGSRSSDVTLYVGDPATGSHPFNFQSKWLAKERGGNIPPNIMDSFGKLVEIAEKNRVPFEDLCSYVIEELQLNDSLKSDFNQATSLASQKDKKEN